MRSHRTLEWSDADRARAKREWTGLQVKSRRRVAGAELHTELHALVMGYDASSLRCLDAGLDRTIDRATMQRVIDRYGSPEPGELDVATEAAAYTLMPRALEGGRMWGRANGRLLSPEETARGLIIDRWVALAGLPFALEAYVASRALHLGREDVRAGGGREPARAIARSARRQAHSEPWPRSGW